RGFREADRGPDGRADRWDHERTCAQADPRRDLPPDGGPHRPERGQWRQRRRTLQGPRPTRRPGRRLRPRRGDLRGRLVPGHRRSAGGAERDDQGESEGVPEARLQAGFRPGALHDREAQTRGRRDARQPPDELLPHPESRLTRLGPEQRRPAKMATEEKTIADQEGRGVDGEISRQLGIEMSEASYSLELSQDQRDIRDWAHGFAEQTVRPA